MSSALFFGQIIIGPAGSGKVIILNNRVFYKIYKSTYCKILQEHAEIFRRNFLVVNLDPAAEIFDYRCDIGIKMTTKLTLSI